ncbi:MAG: sigma-70 family RNA polymerase sigma factor [Vicingaceae bacterium]
MEEKQGLSEKAKYDYRLIKRALDHGDQHAYAELMDKYKESIYYMMLKMVQNVDDADDLTIEAFGKAFKRLDQYVPTYAFSTWLFRIATNNCIDFIRKKRLKTLSIDKPYEDDEGDESHMSIDSGGLNPEQTFIKEQKIKHMRKVVDQLKPRYKNLVVLRYFNELSYEEISEELNLPLGTVKAQLFRAREFLFEIMKNSRDKI